MNSSKHNAVLRQYEIAELIGLRASPLVCKPASLLPKEEWMGQVQTMRPHANAWLTLDKGLFSRTKGKRDFLIEASRKTHSPKILL